MAHLRHIAVHVEEPKPGRFAWVLSERGIHEWQELDRSGSLAASYHQAMADGLLVLQALVPDLDVGPRSPDADDAALQEQENPSENQKAAQAAIGKRASTKTAPAKGSYFGFGPAR